MPALRASHSSLIGMVSNIIPALCAWHTALIGVVSNEKTNTTIGKARSADIMLEI